MDCPKPDWIGDGTCDKVNPKFNMDICQFDKGDCCEEMLIGNGVCEDENNFASCGNFDGGDCQGKKIFIKKCLLTLNFDILFKKLILFGPLS